MNNIIEPKESPGYIIMEYLRPILVRYGVSDETEYYLKELVNVSNENPELQKFLTKSLQKAMQGELNVSQLEGIKSRLEEALADRYASQELTFIMALVITIALVSYVFTPGASTEDIEMLKTGGSAMMGVLMGSITAILRNGSADERASMCTEEVITAITKFNSSRSNEHHQPNTEQ